MPRKPSAAAAPPSGTFPVYLSPQLLATLVRRFSSTLPYHRSYSAFLRSLLEGLAGPREAWLSTEDAITLLALEGFSVEQFSRENRRFVQGLAREDLAAAEDATIASPREALLRKVLDGTATEEELEEGK